MARRSDHNREELTTLVIDAGHALLEEVGFARFSAREVAKRVGYSVGTIYNVFGSLDILLLHINRRTVVTWTAEIEQALACETSDRIAVLVRAYFGFAARHRNLWAALYDHRLPAGVTVPDWYVVTVSALTGLMRQELHRELPTVAPAKIAALARSLLASVHGHCVFAMNGTFDQLHETAPLDAALARVREALGAARAASSPPP